MSFQNAAFRRQAITVNTARNSNTHTPRRTRSVSYTHLDVYKRQVIITDRGRPAHVLLTIEAYQKLTQKSASIAELLAMPGVADVEFEPPRVGRMARAADLS